MRIGDDLAAVSSLQLKVRAQARRTEELESGGAYAAEVERRRSLQREYESRARRLEREVVDLGRLNAKMIRGWWETCEMVGREGEEAVANAMRTARAQEERALRAERRRRLVVSARVAVEVTEYVAGVWRSRSTGGRLHAPFPEGVSDELTYDGSCEALAFLLNDECHVLLAKAASFLSEASGGALEMSVGMVCGLRASSRRSRPPSARGRWSR